MAYIFKHANFYFRVGERPEQSIARVLEAMGCKVIHTAEFPLSLSPGSRLVVYFDPQGKEIDDLHYSIEAHQGFINVPITFYVGSPDTPDPIPDPEPPKTIPDVTNQQMINAFYTAGGKLGVDGWVLITKAKLTGIAGNRAAKYPGPALEDLPLSPAELAALKSALGL